MLVSVRFKVSMRFLCLFTSAGNSQLTELFDVSTIGTVQVSDAIVYSLVCIQQIRCNSHEYEPILYRKVFL